MPTSSLLSFSSLRRIHPMRSFLIFLAFCLLAFHEPNVAEANRYKAAAVKKTVNAQRARPGARARQAARTTAKARVRSRAQRPGATSRLGKRLRAGVAMRAAVKGQRSKTAELRKAGDLTGAAAEIGRSGLRNDKGQFVEGPKTLSFRERFAIWRSTRAVKKAALKGAEQRSKLGSIEGTADALNALAVLEAKGKLGVIGRWQRARATKRAFKNMKKNASKALKAGELEAAGQNFAFAAELRGAGGQTKSMAKTLVKESFQMAEAYAKAGDSQLTWQVLQMAAAIAQEGGANFSEKNAEKLVNKSFKNALPVLTKNAETAFKAGEIDQAVQLLAEARGIRQAGAAKPSRGVARRQDKLAKKLGSRLGEFEAAQAAALQAEAAVGE